MIEAVLPWKDWLGHAAGLERFKECRDLFHRAPRSSVGHADGQSLHSADIFERWPSADNCLQSDPVQHEALFDVWRSHGLQCTVLQV
jgi:hypothetical protein